MAEIDQPEGTFEFCDSSTGAFWRKGRWKRDKLRGAALSSDAIADGLLEPAMIFAAPFHVGWMIETIAHDGEWCDPQWPVYRLVTTEPDPGTTSMEVSWLDLAS